MDDILFGNNNQATINRLAKRSYRANKQRNVFVTIALFLTAFMITSVFSLGCSYFETYQMQQIRAMGTTADVAITSLSEEQYEELSRSSLVSVVGVSQRLGSIDTSGMDDALLSITCFLQIPVPQSQHRSYISFDRLCWCMNPSESCP